MLLATLVFILSLAEKMRAKENGVFFKIDENAFLFNENSIFNGKADSLLSCSQMCAKQDACKSANFIASHGTCSLHTDGQTEQAENILKRDGSLYLEKVCIMRSEPCQSLKIHFNGKKNKFKICIGQYV